MSENKKSFWSSIPGLVTGLAGLLTGVVGLVTVLIQLDVIGGDKSETPNGSVPTTVAGQAPAAGGGGVTTSISGRLTAEPTSVKLTTGERTKTLIVRNNATAQVTVLKPEYKGRDGTVFSVDSGCTNVSLRVGASCTLTVQLARSEPLKTYEASLMLEAKEISSVTEVPVTASTVL
jgi:ribosomal protein L21E